MLHATRTNHRLQNIVFPAFFINTHLILYIKYKVNLYYAYYQNVYFYL